MTDTNHDFRGNNGQFTDQTGKHNPDVLFMADLGNMKVQFRKSGFSYETYKIEQEPRKLPGYRIIMLTPGGDTIDDRTVQDYPKDHLIYCYHRVDVELCGSNPAAECVPEPVKKADLSFISGGNKQTKISSYNRLRYKSIYPGIDMLFSYQSDRHSVKYDFIVHPGGDASRIRLRYNGAESLALDDEGGLDIKTKYGWIKEHIPLCYFEDAAGNHKVVKGIGFQQEGNVILFKGIKNKYAEKLVIDPAVNLFWAKYIGGDNSDFGTGSVVDQSGNIYLCGNSFSPSGIATEGAYEGTLAFTSDGFVTKIDRNGQTQWATYLNGANASDIAISSDGELVITGDSCIIKMTGNGHLIWKKNFRKVQRAVTFDYSGNIVAVGDSLMKLDPDGNELWRQKYGGNGTRINDVGCDESGNIYFAGLTTDSTGIATPGSFLPEINPNRTTAVWNFYEYDNNSRAAGRKGDGFFAKMDSYGSLLFGSYYGGKRFDVISKIAVSRNGTFAIAGDTNSRNGISTPGAQQDTLRQQGNMGGIVLLAFGGGGTGLLGDCQEGSFVYCDSCVSASGYHPQPYDPLAQCTDAFYAKFSSDGTRQWGTYYGDGFSEFNNCLDISESGDTLTVAGIFSGIAGVPGMSSTYSYVKTPSGENYGAGYKYNDVQGYVAQFDNSGKRTWGTYFPKVKDAVNNNDFWTLADVRCHDQTVYVAGSTNGQNFPTVSYPSNGHLPNAYVLSFAIAPIDTIYHPANQSICEGDSIVKTLGIVTNPPVDFDYQWYLNNAHLGGATDSTLVIHGVENETGWYRYELRHGDFFWTDSMFITKKSQPYFTEFKPKNKETIFPNALLLNDINSDGKLDVLSNEKIFYMNSLAFSSGDSIPALGEESAVLELMNDNSSYIFSHEAGLSFNWNLPNPRFRISKLIQLNGSAVKTFDNNMFTNIATWADFDNDGKLEGFKTVFGSFGTEFYLVKFDGDTISQKYSGTGDNNLFSNCYQKIHTADFDKDGDIDIVLIAGKYIGCTWNTGATILENQNGIFHEVTVPFNYHADFVYANAEWHDFDADGDLDILYKYSSGNYGNPKYIHIYENQHGTYNLSYSDTVEGSEPLVFDYDNDGLLDIAVGQKILKGNGTSFTLIPNFSDIIYTGLTEPAKAVGDIDDDGDLDILGGSKIFRNDVCNPPNSPPSAPAGLHCDVSIDTVRFSWLPATDAETPSPGLTYNLRVGASPGGNEILSSMSLESGKRRIVSMGNVYQNTSWKLQNLPEGKYYWSVQAIDNCFAGGNFSAEDTFSIYKFPEIRIQPQPKLVCLGDNVTIKTLGKSAYKLAYQWFKDGQIIENETDTLLHLNIVKESTEGLYYCSVSNGRHASYTDTVLIDVNVYGRYNLKQTLDVTNLVAADFNNDKRLDVIGTYSYGWTNKSSAFLNDDNVLRPYNGFNYSKNFGIPLIADFDNNGFADVLFYQSDSTRLFMNSSTGFHQVHVDLPNFPVAKVLTGDMDNDGDADLVVIERNQYGSEIETRIYYNDETIFTPGEQFFTDGCEGDGLLIDFDSDSDLDLYYSGFSGGDRWSTSFERILRNDQLSFDVNILNSDGLIGGNSMLDDINFDGRPDIVNNGYQYKYYKGNCLYTRLNDESSPTHFSIQNLGIPSNLGGGMSESDFNNDGTTDILINDTIYFNLNGYYSAKTKAVFGKPFDLENDGYTDLLSENKLYVAQNCAAPNLPPSAPSNLYSSVQDAKVTFSWDAASDQQTPSNSLTYNLRVGSTPGGCDVVSPLADNSGFRRIVGHGNVQYNRSWWVQGLKKGTYYWSVQAVDNSFAGGPFSEENSFVVSNHAPIAHAGLDQTVTEGTQVTLDGSTSSDTDGDELTYLWTAPAGITLSDATSATPTFTAPDVLSDTEYTFSLVVNDGTVNSATDEVKITVKSQALLQLKVFLEGPYNPGTGLMGTALNTGDQIPLDQPFNMAPWNYAGTESVTSIPADVTDWVLVELRDAATPAEAITSFLKIACFLKSDGTVAGLDGTSLPSIGSYTVANNLYVVIRHRNHIAVMSSEGLVLSVNTYAYDFSTAITRAYNGAAGYKQLATGVYGMVAGDADADGSVYPSDYNQWASKYNSTGYKNSDFDMDTNVYPSDYNKWATNYNKGNPLLKTGGLNYRSQVPGDY